MTYTVSHGGILKSRGLLEVRGHLSSCMGENSSCDNGSTWTCWHKSKWIYVSRSGLRRGIRYNMYSQSLPLLGLIHWPHHLPSLLNPLPPTPAWSLPALMLALMLAHLHWHRWDGAGLPTAATNFYAVAMCFPVCLQQPGLVVHVLHPKWIVGLSHERAREPSILRLTGWVSACSRDGYCVDSGSSYL